MHCVRTFAETDGTQTGLVGGKGARLAELSRLDGIDVPDGFCVTTESYDRMVADNAAVSASLDALAAVAAADRDAIGPASADLRGQIERAPVPADLAAAIARALSALGDDAVVAVRSSATAEDLPHASFAGQQDSYLDVRGAASVVDHVRRCWASLFTERAVAYRVHNGFDHRRVRMAVVVQRMVPARAAGVMFTADPVTGNRRTTSIEAVRGLAEGLVSGRADAYAVTVHDDTVEGRTVATGSTQVDASTEGVRPMLTDARAVELARLGRRIEHHLGGPQDIEWCLADDRFWFVQSRPITTLFPLPPTSDDALHVYLSVGHQQMMTDAMKPLGLSFWQLSTHREMAEAGGRLFVDVAPMLASPRGRASFLAMIGAGDPLFADALQQVVDRGLVPPAADDDAAPSPPGGEPATIDTDEAVVTDLIETNLASIATLRDTLAGRQGSSLLDAIAADVGEGRRLLFDPRSTQVIMAGMQAALWLNDHLREWLDEPGLTDTLGLAVPNNVTAEMGLALLDLADVARPRPQVVAFLEGVGTDDAALLSGLRRVPGGEQFDDALRSFLDRYGMRCPGEIDITRPRWSENPTALLPTVLGHVHAFAAGESHRRVAHGRHAARQAELDVLARLRELPDGEQKAEQTAAMIARLRTFAGYREFPKYAKICREFVYKQALLAEADRLVAAGVIDRPDDVFFLRFEQLRDVVSTQRADRELIGRRRAEFSDVESLRPPRVFTSDGEIITGAYRGSGGPPGALRGLPVSSGTVEGRARVVLDPARATLAAGDILITRFTDPGWTPLFVAAAALVTEVGGLMTHGAVIAREYGLPAVVGVERATDLIADGQRIRVNGTDGYVEILT